MQVPGIRTAPLILPEPRPVPVRIVRIKPAAGRSWRHLPGATALGARHTTTDLNGVVWWSGHLPLRAVLRDVVSRFPGAHGPGDTTRTRKH